MGNVERCDKTLPLNEMMFHVRRDARLRERWVGDFPALAREFGLSRAEIDAVQAKDPKRLPPGLTREEIDRASKAASDASFYTLSQIAFDKGHRYAALQYTIYCGEKCGNSSILIFEKVKGKWQWTGRFCGR